MNNSKYKKKRLGDNEKKKLPKNNGSDTMCAVLPYYPNLKAVASK